jgi:hypothetical protein
MDPQFLDIARDPRIIPGVHHYCNEWCDYCAVTTRCCGYLCTEVYRMRHGRKDGEPTFTSIDEAVAFTREMSAAEGVRTDELDALLASPPGESGIATTDPLAELAWQYAERVSRLMAPLIVEWMIKPPPRTSGGPAPMETVLWYHLRIYMKVFRALVARETHAGGPESEEALGCGKLALVSIDHSLDALGRLSDAFSAADLADLQQRLTRVRDQLETTIPGARAFIRIGLDEPVACV